MNGIRRFPAFLLLGIPFPAPSLFAADLHLTAGDTTDMLQKRGLSVILYGNRFDGIFRDQKNAGVSSLGGIL